jgi:hypothetical protein
MAFPSYFRNVPDFDYVSRLPGSKSISDYVRVKNLFKRARIRPDIFEDVTYFTQYKVNPNDRPDNVAKEVYGDANLDWVVMLSNNIIHLENEWPLTQDSFNNYCLTKYGSYENLYNVHHYETQEIRDSRGDIIIEKGLQVQSTYSITFFDTGIDQEVIENNIVDEITNLDYEERIQDKKSNIFLLDKRYLNMVMNDINEIMPYKEGSTQFESFGVAKGDNIRLYE